MAVERWTDEMLDEFASSVSEMRNSVSELQNSVFEMRNSIIELRDGVDGLRITAQALLQVAAQNQQKMDLFEQEIELIRRRQAENDERFNVLLEEVRYLIRGNETDRN
jgi:chromosome segregation ATPase